MTEKDLLNQLEKIRIEENVSIEEFYPSLGMSKSTFHLWKRGAIPKSIEVFLKLYELLNN